MRAFRLENIKSFVDSGDIEFKPITIFVGPNSSGKSSLMRFPVVMQQTVKEDISTPLLFTGNQIDYGDFEDVVFGHKTDSDIEFSLKFSAKRLENIFKITSLDGFLGDFTSNDFFRNDTDIKINVKIKKNDRKIQLKEFCLYFNESNIINFILANDKYKVELKNMINNSFTLQAVNFNCFGNIIFNKFIPSVEKFVKEDIYEILYEQVTLKERKFLEILQRSGKINLFDFQDFLQLFEDTQNFQKEDLIHFTASESLKFKELQEKVFSFFMVNLMLKAIETYLKSYFSQIIYIGPFRKDPERVYRFSENRYSQVGKKGEGTILLLSQAILENKSWADNVTQWLESTMNCNLKIAPIDNSLFKIMIFNKENGDNGGENLIDVGYGISQVLPILTQLYYDMGELDEKYRETYLYYAPEKTYIIEQPELHLHPAAQSSLADLFVEKVTKDRDCKILIETHSEHLIRKLQVLVADPDVEISKDDVVIYYVDKNEDNSSTVKRLEMNSKGQFTEKWPAGFFDKSYELTRELIRVSTKSQK
ncbi:MAG: DUF3696 domain-containing protein [Halanaerobiales bacterium]|nr:DUF3696 domain-containing protein [Halanaerobiales bacterium]